MPTIFLENLEIFENLTAVMTTSQGNVAKYTLRETTELHSGAI